MAAKRSQLSEIMGKKAGTAAGSRKLSMDDLGDLLGEGMPDLPNNGVGRFRLIRSLKRRFGDNFRQLPGLSDIISDFDDNVKFESKVNKLKGIKVKRSK